MLIAVILACGLILLLAEAAMWIMELRHERDYLKNMAGLWYKKYRQLEEEIKEYHDGAEWWKDA